MLGEGGQVAAVGADRVRQGVHVAQIGEEVGDMHIDRRHGLRIADGRIVLHLGAAAHGSLLSIGEAAR
ncbi:hypothetical protein C5E51_23390 [Nocardia nova]|nr:hypothetical protein C5E51_23390 [Nocardia nova]